MNCSFLKILKAAFFCAAFSFQAQAKPNIASLESIKQKATELLLQKKKNQAIQLLANYSKLEIGAINKTEANDLLINIAQAFTSREAQEAYENSINLTLENNRESLKSVEQCLALEPIQLDCMIQKMRLNLRAKNNKAAANALADIKEALPNSRFEVWLSANLLKNENEFKNKQIVRSIPDKATEETFALAILELDRSFAAKNYSRAKDIISYLEKHFSDWPDLIFYKNKIDSESAEEKNKTNPEQIVFYINKCKSLSKSVSRKYRYDFDLCARSGEQ